MKILYKVLCLLLIGISPVYAQEKGLTEFLQHMGRIEGHGSYRAVSPTGYLGLYQFHPKMISELGYRVSRREFLQNPELQDSVMVRYMRVNEREIRPLINRKVGTYHNGIYISKAGLLAGAHLMGSAGVWAYFYPHKYKYRTTDGNGVHISHYIRLFSSYNLREI